MFGKLGVCVRMYRSISSVPYMYQMKCRKQVEEERKKLMIQSVECL